MIKFSECVSPGHPDKVADFISEYILDNLITAYPDIKYALEVQIKGRHISVAGETSEVYNDLRLSTLKLWIAEACRIIGYSIQYRKEWNLSLLPIDIRPNISYQSDEINKGLTEGWGDQGIFFGYAEYIPETGFIPVDYYIARNICQGLYNTALCAPEREIGIDIKSQVVMTDGKVTKVVVAVPIKPGIEIPETVYTLVLDCIEGLTDIDNLEIIVNGTGRYSKHGPDVDCGTTGRKLVADFYGGNCKIGGGSPWTKDGSKADLTLNLFARKLALDAAIKYKAHFTASIACCIGKPTIEYRVESKEKSIFKEGTVDIKPQELIDYFDLREPMFAEQTRCGLFGRTPYMQRGFSRQWESTEPNPFIKF